MCINIYIICEGAFKFMPLFKKGGHIALQFQSVSISVFHIFFNL